MMAETDDRVRPEWGVGVFALRLNGELKIIFDDLRRTGTDFPPSWSMRAFVTNGRLDAERFLSHELTDEEYTRIGMMVASRLAAVCQTHEPRNE